MTFRPSILPCLLLPLAVFATPALAAGQAPALPHAAVRVQDDLFLAANGAWLDRTTVPADKSEVYAADLPAIINARVRAIVDDLRRQPQPAGSDARKLVDYFDSEMDTAAIDRTGLGPVRAQLAAIDAIANPLELARWQGRVQGILKTPLWLWGGFADFKDPGTNRVLVMQGGLGLPDRDYYLNKGARMESARAAYLAYLATLAKLSGERHPRAAAQRVLALEKRLAAAHVPAAEATNPARVQPLAAAGLAGTAPGLDWQAFLAGAGIKAGETVNLVHPPGAAAIARLQHELPLDDWKLYFRLRTLDSAAPLLPEPFRAAHFAFRGKALGGQAVPAPRAERALDSLSAALGDALGQAYMHRHFSAQDKARVERIVEVDYLLKPISMERLGQALRKLEARALPNGPVAPKAPLEESSRIFIKDGERCHMVDLAAIRCFESCRNHVQVYFGNQHAYIRKALNAVEERFDHPFNAARKCLMPLVTCCVAKSQLIRKIANNCASLLFTYAYNRFALLSPVLALRVSLPQAQARQTQIIYRGATT
ncbi:hypothetical protein [Massilia niabensis]|uniref:Peptidase M13 N-terminal domain-containing protein n=1 Tax=Massilia niabensis TaxID=544910 RepID=A0ABW0L1I5_9BURK